LLAALEAKAAEKFGDVVLGAVVGDPEAGGDLFVRQPLRDVAGDFALTGG